MKAQYLKTYIIEPVLEQIGLYSESAVNLLLGTAAQESAMGRYIRQIGFDLNSSKGGFGIYQMEFATDHDIWINYLRYKDRLREKIENIRDFTCNVRQSLIADHFYSTAMARIHYLRVPEKLPAAEDIEGMANYWKLYYNTLKGKGTPEEFIENYKRYVV